MNNNLLSDIRCSLLKAAGIQKLVSKAEDGAPLRPLAHWEGEQIVLLAVFLTCLVNEITAVVAHRWKEQNAAEESGGEGEQTIDQFNSLTVCVYSVSFMRELH